MKASSVLMYVGFDHDDLLIRGDLFCAQAVNQDTIELLKFPGIRFSKSNFIKYDFAKSFQDYDRSEISPEGYGDWRIHELPNINSKFRLRLLTQFKSPDRIKEIPFDEVQWFGFDEPLSQRGMNCRCCGGYRTALAELDYPGILLDGTKTYSGRRYRSMDGRHRIEKHLHFGDMTGRFYVFHLDEIIQYFQTM